MCSSDLSEATSSGTGTYDLTVTFAAGAALPQLSVDSQPVTEGAPFVTFTVTADATSASTISVDVMTMDGTAVYPSDYTMFSTTVMIPPGEMTATFDVTIVDDATPEPEETFDVVLSNPVNATILTGTGTATITDDDAVSPQLSVDSPPINEFNTEVTFTVALDVVSASDVTFDVSTVDGTAAAAGGDYTSLVDTITITAGSSLASIPVSILDDAVNEVNETFDLVLSMPVNATILTGTGTATIIDDDP